MSRHERHGTRSLIYSKWHRFYLGDNEPMIDLDGVEYCAQCSQPLVLIETARDVGQSFKGTSVLRKLAEKSGLLALCVLYLPSEWADDNGCRCAPRAIVAGCDHGIARVRVQRIYPPAARQWEAMTPDEYRDRLRTVRMNHLAAHHQTFGAARQGVA